MDLISNEALLEFISPFIEMFFFIGIVVGIFLGLYLSLFIEAIFIKIKMNESKKKYHSLNKPLLLDEISFEFGERGEAEKRFWDLIRQKHHYLNNSEKVGESCDSDNSDIS